MQKELMDKIKQLAVSYTPEWKFDPQQPDSGSVVALLTKNMLEKSYDYYHNVLHRHKIEYYNLFDHLKVEPIQPAKSFVQFNGVEGMEEPIHVPEKTRLLAEEPQTGIEVVFETQNGFTVIPNSLEEIVQTVDSSIYRSHSEQDGSAENADFTPFAAKGDNIEEHSVTIGFTGLFDCLSSFELTLEFGHPIPEVLDATMASFDSKDVSFGILSENGILPFNSVLVHKNEVVVRMEDFDGYKEKIGNQSYYVIKIWSTKACPMVFSNVLAELSGEGLRPDQVVCDGVSVDTNSFQMFGRPMSIYNVCGIDSLQVLARKKASVTLTFSLRYREYIQELQKYEDTTDYKAIMRNHAEIRKPVVSEIRADEVSMEYLSVTGWKKLGNDEVVSGMFREQGGKATITFTVPEDIAEKKMVDELPRIRFKLTRSDNMYQIPGRQWCPIMEGLMLSYTYKDRKFMPDIIYSKNDFQLVDHTKSIANQEPVDFFYSTSLGYPAMYLGFRETPQGTPMSTYFQIENNYDVPVDFTVEYLGYTEFRKMKLIDYTGGMTHSGILLMMVPADVQRRSLFGKDLYWIRIVNYNKKIETFQLPQIKGIFMNTVRVKNAQSNEELFYVDPSEGTITITLQNPNILQARVYINEENDGEEDNWVLWTRALKPEQRGRFYEIDMVTGEIRFAQYTFYNIPLQKEKESVKVVYQNYRGSAANVGVGQINNMERTIKKISSVRNPIAAFGGCDGYNEETSTRIIAQMLRTRNRAVTQQDYFDIISQISYSVRQIKCYYGFKPDDTVQEDAITIAVLIEEFNNGGHIFSSAKEEIRKKLMETSNLLPMGKQLYLTQPRYTKISVRMWVLCTEMEQAYDLQKQCMDLISEFLNPLKGGLGKKGWEIGTLPTKEQLIAFLKLHIPDIFISRMAITALYEGKEYSLGDVSNAKISSAFIMPVNGEHIIYTDIAHK